jgi:hypothetical protein
MTAVHQYAVDCWMFPREDADSRWSTWRVLFSCADCGSDVLQFVRVNPDEHLRCDPCEARHVRNVSDRLLRLALRDFPS